MNFRRNANIIFELKGAFYWLSASLVVEHLSIAGVFWARNRDAIWRQE